MEVSAIVEESSECDSEEDECVDVLCESSNEDREQSSEHTLSQSRLDEEIPHNNFSINRILGLQNEKKRGHKYEDQERDGKCHRPTPISAIPRACRLFKINEYSK